ncbi:hypothetical protein V6N13_134331 [Hibiscus sabdariffa]|uniref:Expansin-like A2 n=1 Tax=Hibiscus sabdariffa TaxID=183260 RepID=A0ABR2R3W4_9ROSI
MAHFLWLLFLLLSSATACDRCVHRSKASYFSSDSALASGACGYKHLALGLGSGRPAAGGSSLYRQGSGCGACFHIRCKNPKLCTSTGTKVILTDLNPHSQADFVLSSKSFMALAYPSMVRDILKHGIVDVEYKRVPCEYKNQNIAVRVEESSKHPNYLAIKLLYQGGQTEVFGINVSQVSPFFPNSKPVSLPIRFPGRNKPIRSSFQVGNQRWIPMRRNYGAVWDTSNAPTGALDFRFAVTHGLDGKWIWAKSVLPANWKPGQVYDCGVQLTAIKQERSSPCDKGTW